MKNSLHCQYTSCFQWCPYNRCWCFEHGMLNDNINSVIKATIEYDEDHDDIADGAAVTFEQNS